MKFTPIYSYKTKDYTLLNMRLNGSKQILNFKTHAKGNKIRILLTNIHNPRKMKIRYMSVVINGEYHQVTVEGKKRFEMPKHSEFYSDEIEVDIPASGGMVIYTRFSLFTKAYSASDFNSTKTITSRHEGWFNRELNLGLKTKAINKPNLQIVALVKQVEVMSDHKTIAWFGDSLTNHSHYTQPLQQRLFDEKVNAVICNAGLSGNRLLKEGRGIAKRTFGISGLDRFFDDVYKYNTPDLVVVGLGINDLIHPNTMAEADELPEISEIIEGYRTLLKTIKEKGSKAILCTITPFKGYNQDILNKAYSMRDELNEWIKNQKEFDNVLDISSIVQDPVYTDHLEIPYEGDDKLHWDAKGGQLLADQIDLSIITDLLK